MRARLAGLLICIFLLGGGVFAAWYFFLRPGRLDFDKLGGTVLVYEIASDQDPDQMWDADRDMPIQVESLQRRLDPDGRGFATVLALGKDRVEIRIPRQDDNHPEDVKRMKLLVTRVGSLEFRILANSTDDADGIAHAKAALNTGGMPGEIEPLKFEIKLAANEKSVVTYSWVELSPHECKALNLDNAAEHDDTRNSVWREAKKFRDKAATLRERPESERTLLNGALFYSRVCEDRNLPEEERKLKAVEYFVLARDAEFDPADPNRRTPRIDGSYLTSAYRVAGQDGRPAVQFAFNNDGANLFRTLTRKNVPTGGKDPDGFMVKRHLGIILDGMVMSAPTINSEIGGQGQISGNFTQQEVDALVNILRSGRLPVALKPLPISEQVVPAKPDK